MDQRIREIIKDLKFPTREEREKEWEEVKRFKEFIHHGIMRAFDKWNQGKLNYFDYGCDSPLEGIIVSGIVEGMENYWTIQDA
jgi:hypothetical protein